MIEVELTWVELDVPRQIRAIKETQPTRDVIARIISLRRCNAHSC